MLNMHNVEYEHRLNPLITDSVAQSADAALEDARKVLQAQIANLRRVPLTMRQRGVPLPPVHRLPEELLYSVFLYLTSDDLADRHDLGWINTTHVCRYWRLVALSNPTLWWDLNLSLGRQWANACLARSQALPLEISVIALIGEEYEYADHLVRKCMGRVTNLFVDVPQALPGRLDGVFICPAPLLESLEFSYDTENLFPSFIDPETTPFSLPAAFLDRANCPRLESLSLSGCVVPSRAPHDLRALSFRNLFADDVLPLFQLLSQLPHLYSLALHFHKSVCLHGEEEKWEEICQSLKSTAMPRLALLELDGHNPECSMIMHYLAAPHLSAFFLKCTIPTGCLDEFAELKDELKGFIGHSSITAKDHADLTAAVTGPEGSEGEEDYTCHIGVSSWSTRAHANATSEGRRSGLSIEFSWPDNNIPELLMLAADVCHAVRLGDVCTLDLDLQENRFDADVLNEADLLLITLESLRTLTVNGIADDNEEDVLVFLTEFGRMRPYEDDTKEGYHFEVVRSALPTLTSHPDDDDMNDPSLSPEDNPDDV